MKTFFKLFFSGISALLSFILHPYFFGILSILSLSDVVETPNSFYLDGIPVAIEILIILLAVYKIKKSNLAPEKNNTATWMAWGAIVGIIIFVAWILFLHFVVGPE